MFCGISEFWVSRNREEMPLFSQWFNMSPDNSAPTHWRRFSFECGWQKLIITWIYYIFYDKISNCFTNRKKISFKMLGDIKPGEGKFMSYWKYVVGLISKKYRAWKVSKLPYHCTKNRNNNNILKIYGETKWALIVYKLVWDVNSSNPSGFCW